MRSQRTRNLFHLFVLLAMVLLVGTFSTVCKSKNAEMTEKTEPAEQTEMAETPDTMATLRTILGEAKEDYPGVEDIEQSGTEIIVYYRFIPKDANTLQEELGEDLAPKIKQIYETDKAADVIHFDVSIPFVEETGGTSYKRQLSFVMTRKIFIETDWIGLLSRDFLKVVQDLKAAD
ncbi:MAG TPA: hypothetical protein VMW46_00460 [Candidatus Desulfaltia sp.]|nr:hypothetical protein [Candidatus Desulfaltia sp.]